MKNVRNEYRNRLIEHDLMKSNELIAEAFYREMHKEGISDNRIINITSNVLSCIIEGMKAD